MTYLLLTYFTLGHQTIGCPGDHRSYWGAGGMGGAKRVQAPEQPQDRVVAIKEISVIPLVPDSLDIAVEATRSTT